MTAKYSISCEDMSISWCDAVLHADSWDELLEKCVSHGREHKGVSEEMIRSPEFVAVIRASMRVHD